MNAGIPEAHAAVFIGADQFNGPSLASVSLGIEAIAKFTVLLSIGTKFPYVNGGGVQVGAGVSAAGVQATITIPGITGCVGRP